MKIAIIISGLRYDAQTNIANSLIDEAKKDGTDLYFFTCDAWGYTNAKYHAGETSIYQLLDFNKYDGIILHGDTLQDPDLVDELVGKCVASGVPAISLNNRHEGMLYAAMENTYGIHQIVDHLITVHDTKLINFIRGPIGNEDSRERQEAYIGELLKHGYPVEEARIYTGDYHPKSGEDAILHWWNHREEVPFPEAIVCANDEMAIGACAALEGLGLRVPEDVKVTGFDNTFMGRVSMPSLTSVQRPERELGALAYHQLMDQIVHKTSTESEILRCEAVFRKSCGCSDPVHETEFSRNGIATKYVNRKQHTITFAEILKSSAAEFTEIENEKCLYQSIYKFVPMIREMDFYLCTNVEPVVEAEKLTDFDIDESAPHTTYEKRMKASLAVMNGKMMEYPEFDAVDIIPNAGKTKGNFYIISPLHFQDDCFGYSVVANCKSAVDSELLPVFIMNVCNAIENIRQRRQLSRMVDKLDRLWIYDNLTNVMNRSGFFRFADTLVAEAKREKEDVLILFIDLDCLKYVNDQFGHDAGDQFIKGIADILRKRHRHGELLMRYGGDEFVVVAHGYSKEQIDHHIEELKNDIKELDESGTLRFPVDASIGYTTVDASEDFSLEEKIEEADQNMYLEKMKKKTKNASRHQR